MANPQWNRGPQQPPYGAAPHRAPRQAPPHPYAYRPPQPWRPHGAPHYTGRPRSRANVGLIVAVILGATAVWIVMAALMHAEQVAAARGETAPPPIAGGPSTAPGPDGPPPAAPTGEPAPGEDGPGADGDEPGAEPGEGPGAGRPAAANPIYRAGALPPTGCQGRQVRQGDSRSMEQFLHATTDCLDRAWAATLPRAGLRFTPPRRVYWTQPGRSPCGDYPASGAAAFYCALNHSIYIGVDHVQEAAGGMPVKWNVAYARGVAHEYAHHVQEISGILEWTRRQRLTAGSIDERDAITRRSELQAQCMAGLFMASVRNSFPVSPAQWRVAVRDSLGRGDRGGSRDHGTGEHYAAWLRTGFQRNTTAACNTWTAAPSDVS